MSSDIVFMLVIIVLGIFYMIYEIVDRICRYKERTFLYGKEEKDKEE